MVQLIHKTDYFSSGDMLFTPSEVASGRVRYAREFLKKQRAEQAYKQYSRPPGYVFTSSKLFFSPKEIASAKRRYVLKKSGQLRISGN